MDTNLLIIITIALIALSIIIYNPAKSYGVPAALVFIIMGIFLGNGELLPAYNYPDETELVSQFALSIIIFTGGFQTSFSRIKPVLAEGLVLANLGVLLSTFMFGYFIFLITPLSLLEGLLLGAIVSSTDAAATFSILDTKKLKLKYNADRTLEFESATNDPMAMILTLLFCMMLLEGGQASAGTYVLYFFKQLLIGAAVAFVVAILLKQLFNASYLPVFHCKTRFSFDQLFAIPASQKQKTIHIVDRPQRSYSQCFCINTHY